MARPSYVREGGVFLSGGLAAATVSSELRHQKPSKFPGVWILLSALTLIRLHGLIGQVVPNLSLWVRWVPEFREFVSSLVQEQSKRFEAVLFSSSSHDRQRNSLAHPDHFERETAIVRLLLHEVHQYRIYTSRMIHSTLICLLRARQAHNSSALSTRQFLLLALTGTLSMVCCHRSPLDR